MCIQMQMLYPLLGLWAESEELDRSHRILGLEPCDRELLQTEISRLTKDQGVLFTNPVEFDRLSSAGFRAKALSYADGCWTVQNRGRRMASTDVHLAIEWLTTGGRTHVHH